jgi:hypothetical protein
METARWADTEPSEDRIRSELRATLRAYQELGPSYEDQVINAFVDRIQPILRSRQSVQPQEPQFVSRRYRRRDRPHFGLLFLLALLFGWFAFFGSAHHVRHIDAGFAFPGGRPSIVAPLIPQQPQQLPSIVPGQVVPVVPVQPVPAQVPQQLPGSSVQ